MMKEEEKYVADSKVGNFDAIQDDEIRFYDLWKVLAKRKMIIIAICLISLLCAAIYSFSASPIYRLETYAKLYMPKDIITIKELPTAKDVATIIGTADREKKAIIFSKTMNEITEAKIEDIKGTPDRFKITIESYNRENLPASLKELIDYVENVRAIKNAKAKIILEIDEKIKNVNEAVKKNDFQIREIEKRLNSSKLLPVGFNPVEINNKTVDLKMEKYRLEQEHKNFTLIELFEDPVISKYPVKPKKALIIVISGICSLMFGIFLAFLVEFFERMKRKEVPVA